MWIDSRIALVDRGTTHSASPPGKSTRAAPDINDTGSGAN
jgi:hypothetical protein